MKFFLGDGFLWTVLQISVFFWKNFAKFLIISYKDDDILIEMCLFLFLAL